MFGGGILVVEIMYIFLVLISTVQGLSKCCRQIEIPVIFNALGVFYYPNGYGRHGT